MLLALALALEMAMAMAMAMGIGAKESTPTEAHDTEASNLSLIWRLAWPFIHCSLGMGGVQTPNMSSFTP